MSTPGAGPVGVGTETSIFAMPLSILRRVRRDASWSLAGNLLTVLSGLATLKIIGKFVPAADYGTASLVLGLCALLNQFIAGPLLTERIRLYFDQLKLGSAHSLSRDLEGVLLRTSAAIAGAYLVFATAAYFRGQAAYFQLFLPVLVLIFLQPQLSAAFGQLEAERNYRGLSFAQPMLNVLQVPLLMGLLILAVSGPVAIVLAQGLAASSVFAILALRWRKRAQAVQPSHDSQRARASMSPFAWSLYAFNLTSWMASTSDRYLVDHFLQRSDVGIYVINYAFWAIPYTVVNGWINSFARPRLYGRAADQEWGRVLRVVMATLGAGTAIAVAGTGLLYFIGKPLALWILGEKYWHSESLMMLLATAHIFFIVGHTASTYFLAIKNSHWVWVSLLIAATCNVGANILLLPKWGILAAAATTFGAYALWSAMMLVGIVYWSRRMAKRIPA